MGEDETREHPSLDGIRIRGTVWIPPSYLEMDEQWIGLELHSEARFNYELSSSASSGTFFSDLKQLTHVVAGTRHS